jgi:hypothetical protein
MAESPTEEAATATAGAGAAGPGSSGVAGVVGVSGSGGGFGPPFLPDVWAAAAAAGGAGGPGSGLAPLPGLPPSAAAHGAALLSHWDPTLSSDWDGERTAPQCLLRIKRWAGGFSSLTPELQGSTFPAPHLSPSGLSPASRLPGPNPAGLSTDGGLKCRPFPPSRPLSARPYSPNRSAIALGPTPPLSDLRWALQLRSGCLIPTPSRSPETWPFCSSVTLGPALRTSPLTYPTSLPKGCPQAPPISSPSLLESPLGTSSTCIAQLQTRVSLPFYLSLPRFPTIWPFPRV